MKLAEYNKLEADVLNNLRDRATAGDNDAARVLLNHIIEGKRQLGEWQASRDANKQQPEQT